MRVGRPGGSAPVSIHDWLTGLGLTLVVSGVALWSVPAALVVAGLSLAALGLIGAYRA